MSKLDNVFIISSSENFLYEVYKHVTSNSDQIFLSKTRIYLPNNRSCRFLKEIFVKNACNISSVPKIITPLEVKQNNNLLPIIRLSQMIDNHSISFSAKFELALSLFNNIKNILFEQVNIHEIIDEYREMFINQDKLVKILSNALINPYITNTIRDIIHSISSHTGYVRKIESNCFIAGFNYSHKYLMDFIKTASENKNNKILIQDGSEKIIEEFFGYTPTNKRIKKSEISIIESCSTLAEAEIICLIIKNYIDSGKSIQLISTDKRVSKNVKLLLSRWNINIDDSVGDNLKETKIGTIILLASKAIELEFNTESMLELLLYAFGDQEILRDFEFFMHKSYAYKKSFRNTFIAFIATKDMQNPFDTIIKFVEYALQILSNPFIQTTDIISLHKEFLDFILHDIKKDIEYIDEIESMFHEIYEASDLMPRLGMKEYNFFISKILNEKSVRSPYGYTKNLISIGPIEAQILTSDITIICGFSDENWIIDDESYIFSNEIKKFFHLNVEDRRNSDIRCTLNHVIHSSKHVFITNSKFKNGSHQELCRLINTFLSDQEINDAKNNGIYWENLHKTISKNNTINSAPAKRPCPSPPLHFRPKIFSISDIDLLCNNPYSLYAKKILNLKPLVSNHLHKLKGIIIHKAIENIIRKRVDIKLLENEIYSVMNNMNIEISDFSDWMFKIPNIVDFFSKNMQFSYEAFTACSGEMELSISDEFSVKVTCIVDSIFKVDNKITIIDYKTGTLPTFKSIINFQKPQLLIEGLIALNGGFKRIENCTIEDLVLLQLGGTSSSLSRMNLISPRKIKSLDLLNETIINSEKYLKGLIKKYTIDMHPFWAISSGYYDEYAHLSRGKEWGMYR